MLCPICKKEHATNQVIKFLGENMITGFVCDKCYDKAMSLDLRAFYYYFVTLKNKRCSVCGRSYEEFSNTLLLGCPNCYNEFSLELKPLVDSIQK